MSFPDFRLAPNQGGRPDLYELENRAIDPDGLVLQAMRQLAPWAGRTLVDLGCGSGYWLPGYAAEASEAIGVEPDPALLTLAWARRQRARGLAGGSSGGAGAQRRVRAVRGEPGLSRGSFGRKRELRLGRRVTGRRGCALLGAWGANSPI